MLAPPPAILRFPGHGHPDLVLGEGVNGLCRDPDHERALMLTPGGGASPIEFCCDQRGLWLNVGEGVRGVHVNGRPVQRLAHLRLGDTLHFEGIEMQLVDARPRPVSLPGAARTVEGASAPHIVLRGVCGLDHGRALALVRPLRLGADDSDQPAFDVRIDDGEVRVASTSDHYCQVNGQPLRAGVLRPGDQLVFAPDRRYVLESPPVPETGAAPRSPAIAGKPAAGRQRRFPWWLLLAGLLMACGLAALLSFGVR